MKNVMNTGFCHGVGVQPSCNATFPDLIKKFFENIKKKCCELSLVNSESTNNKQNNYNKVDSQLPFTKDNCLGLLLHSDKLLISLALSFAMSSLLQTGFALLTRRPTQNPLTTHYSLLTTHYSQLTTHLSFRF